MDDETNNEEELQQDANQEQQGGNQSHSGNNILGNTADRLQGLADNARKANDKVANVAQKLGDKAGNARNLAAEASKAGNAKKAKDLTAKAEKLEKRVEKLKKKTEKIEKLAKKAEKFSKLALKLGKIIAIIGGILLILVIVIGLLVFIIVGWGMLMSGFKALAQGFFDACEGVISGSETVLHDDEVVTVLSNIEQMGYELYGYGFVSSRAKDDEGKNKYYDSDESSGDKSLIEELEKKNAYRNIMAYMVSDNYAYFVKNHNFSFRSMTSDGANFFSGIFDKTDWGSGLISLYNQDGGGKVTGKRGEAYGVSAGNFLANVGAGAGLGAAAGSVVPGLGTLVGGIVGGVTGVVNTIIGNWDEVSSSIKINRSAKTLEIGAIGLTHHQIFSYSLDGWTGRYSMPLEFLLATHVATMAPDLSYKLATSFNTDVEIILYKADDVKSIGGIQLSDGTKIWYQDGFCYADGSKSSINEVDAANTFKKYKDKALDSQKDGDFVCTGVSEEYDHDTTTSEASSSEVTSKLIELINKKLGENSIVLTGAAIDETFIDGLMKPSTLTDVNTYTNYMEASTGRIYRDEGSGGKTYSCTEKFSRTAEDGVTHTITCNATPGVGVSPENDMFFVSVELAKPSVTRDKTCSEIIKEGIDLKETCSNCAKYIDTLYQAAKIISDNDFEIYIPYINCVTDHWFRDVYFTYNAMKEHGAINDDGTTNIITTDKEYEKKTTERWTKYIEDPRGEPELYVFLKDDTGEYNGNFSKVKSNGDISETDGEYLICRETEAGKGKYTLKNEGENTYVKAENERGNFNLYLLKNESSTELLTRYKYYSNDKITEFKVGKKAITMKVGAGEDEISTDWIAYSEDADDVNKKTSIKTFTKDDVKGNTQLEKAMIVLGDDNQLISEVTTGTVKQTDDGLRGETNGKIKQMFLDDYYIYDGSESRAALIEEAKNKVQEVINNKFLATFNAISNPGMTYAYYVKNKGYDVDNPDTYKQFVKEGLLKEKITAKIMENGKEREVSATINEISGGINLVQNSLTAFNILTNMHTLDAEYIYHDFKELVVELDYFDKEDLTQTVSNTMMFPVSGVSSAGWPVARYDVGEEFYGTLIHSAEDYEAKRAETALELAEMLSYEKQPEEKEESITETSESHEEEKEKEKSYTTDNLLVCAAKDIYDYTVADGGYDYSQPKRASSFEVSKTNKFYDCSGYVSWCLQLVGIFDEGEMTNSRDIRTLSKLADYYKVGAPSKLEPGMILIYNGHVNIYAGEDMYYDGGEYGGIKYKTYNGSIEGYINIPNDKLVYNGMAGSNAGTSITSAEFEGYEGGEPVLAPVTGEVIKYGTVKRTNIELVNNGVPKDSEEAQEEVGFIKIKVLGDTECKPTREACKYFKKQNDEWEGYDYFWEEYSDAGVTNHVLYIEGFDVSQILGDKPDSKNGVKGTHIKTLADYINKEETENAYSTKYEVPILLDKEKQKQLEEREEAKENAPYTITVAGEEGGNDRIFVKEGAVIGYTYKTEDAKTVEKEITLPKSLAGEEEEDSTAGTSAIGTTGTSATTAATDEDAKEEQVTKTYKVGNYMRLILRDKDDQVVENIEDYIEIDEVGGKTNNSDIDWEFWYYSSFEGGAWDEKECGPEAVKDEWGKRNFNASSGTYNLDVGIIQWTSNGGGLKNVQEFCRRAAEKNTALCGTLSKYVSYTYEELTQSVMSQMQKDFTAICNINRDEFLKIQIEMAIEDYFNPALQKYPWLESRPSVVKGTVMSACVANGGINNLSESMSNEEVIKEAINQFSDSLATRKNAQQDAALQILNNEVSIDKVEEWVRHKVPPNEYWNLH